MAKLSSLFSYQSNFLLLPNLIGWISKPPVSKIKIWMLFFYMLKQSPDTLRVKIFTLLE